MKKALFSFCALLACLVLSSCGNPTETLKSIAKDIEDAKEISAKDAYNYQKKALEAQIDFYKSNATEEEYEEFKDALEDYKEARRSMRDKLDDDFDKDSKDMKDEEKELQKLDDEVDKAKKEFKKKMKENKKDKD